MITIVTRWETHQMPAELEWRMWHQLRGAFKIDRFVFVPIVDELSGIAIDQFATMEEALESCEGQLVFLEPTGGKTVSEIPAGDIVLVLGNSGRNNLKHAAEDETYRIAYAGPSCLYGTNAAAIALAYRRDHYEC